MPPEEQRNITYAQAVRESLDQALGQDPLVYIIGLGAPDPKGIFGTTVGLAEKHGADRVIDMPVSENAMTGIALGSAITGMRPVMTHQRLDFVLLAMEQIVGQAAKWHFMFGGNVSVPLVIRLVIGRGWGQGPQHSQSLHSWFAHIPGLKVVMPTTPYDAKGLLTSSIEDNNPVIFLEHRWLHNTIGNVPEETYRIPLGTATIRRAGTDVTIVSLSHMNLEALRAADILTDEGISVEIVDVRSLRPLDDTTIIDSVKKTGRLVVAEPGNKFLGFSSEISAMVTERVFDSLKAAPVRIAYPDYPVPTSQALSADYYPRAIHIAAAVRKMLGRPEKEIIDDLSLPLDIPDPSFKGPF